MYKPIIIDEFPVTKRKVGMSECWWNTEIAAQLPQG